MEEREEQTPSRLPNRASEVQDDRNTAAEIAITLLPGHRNRHITSPLDRQSARGFAAEIAI